MTSARATGVLVACVYQGVKPTVEAVQSHFGQGGRHMYLSALKELEDLGFLCRKKMRIGNDLRTECVITEQALVYLVGSGFPTPENLSVYVATGVGFSDLLFRQKQLGSSNSQYKLNSKTYSDESYQSVYVNVEAKEDEMPYEFFESSVTDDHLQERAEDLKKSRERYQEKQKEKRERKIILRQDVPKAMWTCSDIAYEFAYRLEFHWHIPPWSVRSTDFVKALGGMRNRLGTNGEIEFEMINLFCDAINFQDYKNAEHLWRLFVKRADEFASKARGMVVSEEELEEATSQARKSQEWLYE
jgi:hypothetical protein